MTTDGGQPAGRDRETATLASSRAFRVALVGAAVLAAVALDQLTKNWALSDLGDEQKIPLIPTVRLELYLNPGVAFGIGSDVGAPLVVGLLVVMSALLAWVAVRAFRGGNLPGTIFLALAAGGGIGNLLDRVLRAENGALTGRVVDFIVVDWFAVFNVADIFTTCGIALWALTQLRVERPRKEATADH